MIATIPLQLFAGQTLQKKPKVFIVCHTVNIINFMFIPCFPFILSTKPASKVRVVKARKKKGPRRPYYDEKDREALLLMRRLRVTWSDMEDSFLLVCKV